MWRRSRSEHHKQQPSPLLNGIRAYSNPWEKGARDASEDTTSLSGLTVTMLLPSRTLVIAYHLRWPTLSIGPLIAGDLSKRFLISAAELRVLFEVESLMMVFGVGASPCCSDVRVRSVVSRLTEVACTAIPAGTSPAAAKWSVVRSVLSGCLGLAPFEDGAIRPDAMQDDGDLACDRDFGLFHADALREATSSDPRRARETRTDGRNGVMWRAT